MSSAETDKDEGTPAEQSRRTFMVRATVALGSVIGLGIAIPVVMSLVPSRDALSAKWSRLSPQEFAQLQKATQKPVNVSFAVKDQDGYLPEASSVEFVWAIRTDEATMRAKRPEFFNGPDKVDYSVVNLVFVVFSPTVRTSAAGTTGARSSRSFRARVTARNIRSLAFTPRGRRSAGSIRFRYANSRAPLR